MGSLNVEDTMISLFRPHLNLSDSRVERLASVATGMLLAGTAQLPKVARWLKGDIQQDSRVKMLEHLLDAPYLTQEQVYQPLLAQALRVYHATPWHLVMDRTSLGKHIDLLAVTLSFRSRSIPLIWQVTDFGCTGAGEQLALLKRVLPLIPAHQPVVFHGDTEFGSVEMMRFVQAQEWHFILAQPANTLFCRPGRPWEMLVDLPVTPRHAIYLSDIFWTQQHHYGPLNLYAFYAPHQNSAFAQRREFRYCATSLSLTHTIRRVGRHRWGIEPFFRDYKSSGWEIEASALTYPLRLDRLLTLLSLDYLWATCLGRWLCKTGRRSEVDSRPDRHLSLFRLGYDWLIHQFRMERPWPPILALYA
jgi:hypothetical protein